MTVKSFKISLRMVVTIRKEYDTIFLGPSVLSVVIIVEVKVVKIDFPFRKFKNSGYKEICISSPFPL